MGIYDDIKNFNKQFEYDPVIENAKKLALSKVKGFVVAGMGGSHLAADLIRVWRPDFPLVTWNDYGLPPLPHAELKKRLVIAVSYSGNTEETISVFLEAKKKRIPVAAVASGGKLIRLAQKSKTPYVEMPDLHVQPRLATGLMLKAILKLVGERSALAEAGELAKTLRPVRYEHAGRDLAKRLHGSVPIIYSSVRNAPIAQNWKIKFNETGKIPAFWNVVPEMNHNELTGFSAGGGSAFGGDVHSEIRKLSKRFHFIFLKDRDDNRQIMKRMNVMERLLRERGFKIEVVLLHDHDRPFLKIFQALTLADWTAYYTAKMYNVDPERVPMVEEFKNLIR